MPMTTNGKRDEPVIVRRLFLENVIPACSTSAVLVVGNLVDAAVTGQCLGKAATAAFGVANPILLGVIGLGGMLGVGAVIGIGGELGNGEKDGAGRVFAATLLSGLTLGTLIMLLLLAFPSRIASAMGAGPALLDQASGYLKGYAPGVPAFFLQTVLGFIMPLDGDKERVVTAMSVCVAVNVALDLLNGFVLRMGLFGMALATSVSYWAEFLVLICHFRRKETLLRLAPVPFRFRTAVRAARDGLPYALQLLMRMLGVILINRIILAVSGVEQVAVFSLLMSCANLILIDGTAVGTTVLTVENCVAGDGDARSVTALMKTAIAHALLVNLALSGFFIAMAPAILRLFMSDPAVLLPAVPAFRLFATCPAVYAVNYALRSHLQCMRRTGLAVAYAAFDVLIGPVAAALLLSRAFGLRGIWLCYTAGELLALTGLLLCAAVRSGGRFPDPAGLLFLGPEFDRAEEPRLFLTIRRGEEALRQAAEASGEVVRFMLSRGADGRQAALLGLCAEEIAENVVRHGFKKPRHALEIGLRKRGNGWILRIRDNCAYFNVAEYLRIQDEGRERLGLRIVKGIAHDVGYMSALRINCVTIRMPP